MIKKEEKYVHKKKTHETFTFVIEGDLTVVPLVISKENKGQIVRRVMSRTYVVSFFKTTYLLNNLLTRLPVHGF